MDVGGGLELEVEAETSPPHPLSVVRITPTGRCASPTQDTVATGPWVIVKRDNPRMQRAIAEAIEDLTLRPIMSVGGVRRESKVSIPAYRLTAGYLYVPRGYALQKWGGGGAEHDRVSNGEDVSERVWFAGSLRNQAQTRFVTQLLAHLRHHETRGTALALGSAEPGCGKTVMFLHLWAHSIRRKCLVIVRGLSIVAQWVSAIRRFVPEANVGVIQRDTWQIEGRDIVVASADTLAKRADRYKSALWDRFGIVCFDEAHHIVAATLVRVYCTCMRARYCVALTGTPDRKDGLTHAMPWFIGPNAAHMKNEQHVHVRVVRFEGGAREHVAHRWGPAKGRPNDAAMISKLAEDGARLDVAIRILMDCIRAKRRVLVLTSRTQLRDELCARITAQCTEEEASLRHVRLSAQEHSETDTKIRSEDDSRSAAHDALLLAAYLSDPSEAEAETTRLKVLLARKPRKRSRPKTAEATSPVAPSFAPWVECLCAEDSASTRLRKSASNVLIATYVLAREALDLPSMDTVFFLTPAVDVRQAIGRIRRAGASETSSRATSSVLETCGGLAIDLVDTFPPFDRWAWVRNTFYRKEPFIDTSSFTWRKEEEGGGEGWDSLRSMPREGPLTRCLK